MTPWSRGAEVDLHQVPLDQFRPGSSLVITEANYFGAKVKAAGTVQRVEMVKDGSYLYLTLTGTDSEELLRAHGGRREQVFQAHLCPAGCGQQESGDHFLHALKGRQGQAQEEGWVTCLETGAGDQGEDELELLRKRDRELGTPEERGGRRCQGAETQKESFTFCDIRGKGQEEKEEEGEKEEGGLCRRSTCRESSAERVGSPLRGDGTRPKGTREETGHAPSPAFCSKETRGSGARPAARREAPAPRRPAGTR